MGKPQLCMFIVQVSGRQIFELFSQQRGLWALLPGDKAASWYNSFMARLFWIGHSLVILQKSLLCMWTVQVSWETALSLYDSFSGKMILERPFISNPVEALALHVHCSGLLKTELWIYISGKIVLKRPCVCNTEEDCSTHSLFRSQEDRAWNHSSRRQIFEPFS